MNLLQEPFPLYPGEVLADSSSPKGISHNLHVFNDALIIGLVIGICHYF